MSTLMAPMDAREPAPAASELAGLRVLLVHQWLYTWAGAERCLEQLLALMPHADVLTGVMAPAVRRDHPVVANARTTWVNHVPGAHRGHRWFLPLHALAFGTHDAGDYDLVISVSHAFEKAVVARKPGAVHLCYCLTPPRYLWDLSESHDRLASPLQRLALGIGRAPLRALDRASARRVDRFVSLSRHVAARVRRVYRRDSAVVYPPVARKSGGGRASSRADFLLSLGRLVPYKRVDLAIAAAARLGLRLVVAGDGPDRSRLERMAGPNVEFAGEVSESRAAELLAACAAFVFCAEEDFGIAPVEANAHGAPVVAFAQGGAAETIRDGVTGVLFAEQTVDSVVSAVERCLAHRWDAAALSENALRFAPEHFRSGMREQIGLALGEDVRA